MIMTETAADDFKISEKALRHLAQVDAMPAELRACVHEFGYTVVSACLDAGVDRPNRIRQLVHMIWEGARHERQSTGAGYQSAVMLQLDWLLVQAGAQINARELVGFLQRHCWTMLPLHPTRAMIDASVATIAGFDVACKKWEKHQRRLIAAIEAGSKSLFPQLYTDAQLQRKPGKHS